MEQSDLPGCMTPARGRQALSTHNRVAESRGFGKTLPIGPTCVIVGTAIRTKDPPTTYPKVDLGNAKEVVYPGQTQS